MDSEQIRIAALGHAMTLACAHGYDVKHVLETAEKFEAFLLGKPEPPRRPVAASEAA